MFEKSTSDARPAAPQHRCIAGPACTQAERVDGQRHGARTAAADALCEPCVTHIADCVRQLPRDYRALSASLGERATDTGEYVKSTPTPAIPINAQGEALMAKICEIADRAAAVVSEQLKMDNQPDGARRLPDINITPDTAAKLAARAAEHNITISPGTRPAGVNTIALNTHDHTRPTPINTLTAHVRLIQPNIERLAAAPADDHLVWSQPGRCNHHTTLIESAEVWATIAPPGEDREDAKQELDKAHRKAAACDNCNGWSPNPRWGQGRQLATLTGLDITQQLRDIHHQTRAYLGQTKLRHKYQTACPAVTPQGTYCGAMTVGRQDGQDWVDCQTCGTQWTEREFDWLKTQIAGDKEIELLRYLLEEAYWRLDTLQRGANMIRNDPRLNEPGSGQFVLDGIDLILNAGTGHQPPEKRQTIGDNRPKKAKARRA